MTEPTPVSAAEGAVPAPEAAVLAPRLRELRTRAGLSLETAAASAGLSPAHLSRMETGLRQPSLPTLLGLARLYGTTVSDLLGENAAEPDPIVRRAVPATDAADVAGWRYARAGGAGRALQALRVQVTGRAQDALVRVHPGEEWLYVLDGRLRVILGDRTHLLEPGDAAHFDSSVPHRIAAEDDRAELLFVHTLLQAAACIGSGARVGPGGHR